MGLFYLLHKSLNLLFCKHPELFVWCGSCKLKQKSKLKSICKTWLKFFKFQSMSILAIHSNRRQETVSMPKYSLK